MSKDKENHKLTNQSTQSNKIKKISETFKLKDILKNKQFIDA